MPILHNTVFARGEHEVSKSLSPARHWTYRVTISRSVFDDLLDSVYTTEAQIHRFRGAVRRVDSEWQSDEISRESKALWSKIGTKVTDAGGTATATELLSML